MTILKMLYIRKTIAVTAVKIKNMLETLFIAAFDNSTTSPLSLFYKFQHYLRMIILPYKTINVKPYNGNK